MTKQQFYKDMECTETQRHLKECKKCSPETNQEGWWEKEFEEENFALICGCGNKDTCPRMKSLKSFISKVAKTERGKYPEGYQGEE